PGDRVELREDPAVHEGPLGNWHVSFSASQGFGGNAPRFSVSIGRVKAIDVGVNDEKAPNVLKANQEILLCLPHSLHAEADVGPGLDLAQKVPAKRVRAVSIENFFRLEVVLFRLCHLEPLLVAHVSGNETSAERMG